MGLSIQGALNNWTKKQFASAFTDEETGLPVSSSVKPNRNYSPP